MTRAAGSAPQPPTEPSRPAIALIGAGPRGVSLLERIGAHLRPGSERSREGNVYPGLDPSRSFDLHIIDDAQSGAGRIWRTDQDRELCMNTLAHAVTLFTEPGATITGPVAPGPTLYEWCILVRDTGNAARDASVPGTSIGVTAALSTAGQKIPAAHVAAFSAQATRAGLASEYAAELTQMRPESHPSRALYGEYLAWCYARALAALPPQVRVIRHIARATAIERVAGRERLELSIGEPIVADAVIMATGWLPRASTRSEHTIQTALAGRPELTWVRPGSPVDQDLSGVLPGSHAIVRGLGMGFFDTMALLTIGRGGRFEADASAVGGLRYVASGREPILHVTSRRGVPFRAKSLYRSLPPRAPQALLREVDWDALPRPINFDQLFWPRVVGDAFLAHAETLLRVRPEAVAVASSDARAPLAQIEASVRAAIEPFVAGSAGTSGGGTAATDLDAVIVSVSAAVARFIPDSTDRFDLAGEIHPGAHTFAGPAAFDAWVKERVAADLAEAELGRDSPLKSGLWSVSSARAFAGKVGTLGGFDAESRSSGYAQLLAVGGMVGSGPPAFRNRQLLALTAAGFVRFIGPETQVRVDPAGFTAQAPGVAGSEVSAPTLVDAWMHFHDVRASADPLAQSLIEAGRARDFEVRSRAGSPPRGTGGIDIEASTGRLRNADGAVDPAVHAAGIPVDQTLHDTVISPMPGIDPPMLRETDRVALSALQVALSAGRRVGVGVDPAQPIGSAPAASVVEPNAFLASTRNLDPDPDADPNPDHDLQGVSHV